MSEERTEPTNEELAQGYAKQIEQAQQRREANDQERLERHGQAAANLSQSIEAEQQKGNGFELDASQKGELNEINGQQAKTLAKELNRDNENGDTVKQARAKEIAEQFKEKAARDREQSRSYSR